MARQQPQHIDPFARLAILINQLNSLDYRQRRKVLWNQDPRMPRFLYKFRALVPSDPLSVDRMRDLVVRSRFWLSSPVDFNDPFDMSAKFIVQGTLNEKKQRIKEILKFQGHSWAEQRKLLPRLMAKPNEELARLAQGVHQDYVRRAGVYSFGGDPRNILMWSHYAANQSGFCFLFEVARDIQTFALSVTMKYSQDYPIINWVTGFDDGLVAVIERKHEGWRYEKETRVVLVDAARRYIPFKPEALQGIIIGCRATGEAINQLNELILERRARDFSPPKLYCALQHESKYKLVIQSIPNIAKFISSRSS